MAKTGDGTEDKRSADLFDRSFKQIISSLSPGAMIRFINGLFGCDYPPDSEVHHLSAEQIGAGLEKRLPDEVVSVAGRTYIIEEQTTSDANMAIRVFEYSFAQALREKESKDGIVTLPFPRAAVIYLEAGRMTPDRLEVRMMLPGGAAPPYMIETVKLLDQSVAGIVERGLSVLLPFYILKLRKAARQAKTVEERKRVEATFRDLGIALKETIEKCAEQDKLSDEDIATLLERLAGLIKYVGRGYQTTEVKDMLNKMYMGYGTRMRLQGERKGAAMRRRLEKEVERLRRENQEVERLRQENQEVERLRQEIEELKQRQQTA